MGFSINAYSGSATLTWQKNNEPDLNQYHLYYGKGPRNYGAPVPVGQATQYTLNNLDENQTYYFALTATDNAGNESGFSAEVQKQISGQAPSAPTLTITSPTAEENYTTNSAFIQVSGTASGANPITRVTWSVPSLGSNGVASGTNSWSASGTLPAEGVYLIVINAVDSAGQSAQDTITVNYSTSNPVGDKVAPTINITQPTSNPVFTSNGATFSLAGTASDDQGLAEISWSSSTGQSGKAVGTSNWSIPNVQLANGSTVITVKAVDQAGNVGSDGITVIYQAAADTTPPAITIQSPTANSTYFIRNASVALDGVAQDNQSLSKVVWQNSRGGEGICSGTNSWQTGTITLALRWNTITVTAIDQAGNTKDAKLMIYRW